MQVDELGDWFSDQIPVGVVLTAAPSSNEPVVIGRVNNAMAELTGFRKDELIGISPKLLHGKRTNLHALRRMKRLVESGRPARLTIVNYRKSGERYLCDMEVHPVFSGDEMVAAVSFEKGVPLGRGRLARTAKRSSALSDIAPKLAERYPASVIV